LIFKRNIKFERGNYMSESRLLKDQIALVTGASSGIGEGIAKAMGAAGAKVVVNFSSNEDAANRVVQGIKDSGAESIAVRADVSNEDQVVLMFKTIFDEYGTIDILVNNSGIQKDSPFLDMTLEQWERVLDVNLTGAFLCSREAAREFIRRGVVPERSCAAGKIIFISSVHEVIPWAGHVNYAASKGGIMLFMKSIAQELAPHRIRVNSIGPGAIKTNINRATWETPEAKADLLQLIPYRKIGEPADIARVAVWLASDEADYITGTTIYADGGMLLYPGFSAGG
jgi:glucose 1-dehydrogenase